MSTPYTPSPLAPLSANSNKLPAPPLSATKFLSDLQQEGNPLQSSKYLNQKQEGSVPKSPTKLKTSFAPESPFMDFSPVASSRAASPSKKTVTRGENMEDYDILYELDDSVCSSFSDVEYGSSNGAMKSVGGNVTSRKSPVESRPENQTPRSPRTARRPAREASGAPEAPRTPGAADRTANLLDFTAPLDGAAGRPTRTPNKRTQSSSPRKASPTKMSFPPSTPTESRFFNLLDFTPGTPQSPRSIPSITPREVDEIKAGFNSQMALLSAQLSGRDVEVTGLRTAFEGAESRCTELSNTLTEQSNRFDEEREEWQKIKMEMGELFETEKKEKESASSILCENELVVENLHGELEGKTVEVKNLKKRLRNTEDELERTRDEVKKVKTEAATALAAHPPLPSYESSISTLTEATCFGSDAEEAANKRTAEEVERVARELHTLYKAKHETKVAALKKSYEGRWEKKVMSLQQQVEQLTLQNAELSKRLEDRTIEEAAEPSFTAVAGATSEESEKLRKRVEELEADLRGERTEREEVVALVEELLAIQANAVPPPGLEEDLVVEEEKSVAEEKKPVVEQKKPVVEQKKPVVEQKKPVVEQKKPVVEQKRKPRPRNGLEEKKPAAGLRSGITKMGMGARKPWVGAE